ncbi:hypothetical protein MKY96_32515 [Paenibacillus sp. FSL R7-0302]|uniref:hypothetical protein n=1 Tax=Paenibacillus sp. FSL R7-0302 TaxID=2921681 RepID=UPI0030F9EA7E
MHKQRYIQKKKVANTVRVRMIKSFNDFVEGREYHVDSLMADFLVVGNRLAVQV